MLIEKTSQLIPISYEEFQKLSTKESRKENILKILREEKFLLRPTLKSENTKYCFSEFKSKFSEYRLFVYWIRPKDGRMASIGVTKSKDDWFYIQSNFAVSKLERNYFKVKGIFNLQVELEKIFTLNLK